MSWYRQVKTLFTLSFTLFFFIVYAVMGNLLFNNVTDYRLYLISLSAVFLMQFLIEKEINKVYCISLPSALMAAAIVLKGGRELPFDIVYCLFILFLTWKQESTELSHEVFRSMTKKAAYFIIALGIVLPFIDKRLSGNIVRFYPMFLIAAILGLRESRAFSNKIKNKNSIRTNALIIGSIVLLSLDQVSQRILKLVGYFYQFFLYIADKVFNVFLLLLSRPLTAIGIYTAKLSKKMKPINIGVTAQEDETGGKISGEVSYPPHWMETLLKIIILLIVLFLIYKLISKFIGNRDSTINSKAEERQKLEKVKKERNSNYKLKNIFKDIFRGKNVKEQILAVFKSFQEKTDKKGIFKNYMTATQLINVTRAYIEDGKDLNPIKDIYNEAKFSNHSLEEEKFHVIKEGYKNVRKQL